MPLRDSINSQSVDVTDEVLAQQTLAGDHEAFARLVRRYSRSLFRFICRFLPDYDVASDVLQQVFAQLYISLPNLRPDGSLKPWLFQITRNRCLDELRRKRVISFSELQTSGEDDELSPLMIIPDPDPLPEEVAEHHDLQYVVREAVAGLPPKYRAVVLLRSTFQMSFPEIGQALQMPEATAKTYYQRAKPLLRVALASQVRLDALL